MGAFAHFPICANCDIMAVIIGKTVGAVAKAQKKLRKYPYSLIILSVGVITCVAQVIVILDCIFPIIVFDTEAVCSVMSTCAEVVAGLYGITLTGYIFFADRFRDTSDEDESLYDAVQALLLRYNHMAGIISVMCLLCIVVGEGIVLYGSNTILPQGVYRFIVNETLLLFFLTFDFILYFVISVLDPQKVSRISSQQKTKISGDRKTGDPEQFMADWKTIEELLMVRFERLRSTFRLIPGARNKPAIIHMLETLRNYGGIGPNLWRKLERLRQYHNLALHDPNMTVSQEMCALAKEVLAELEEK